MAESKSNKKKKEQEAPSEPAGPPWWAAPVGVVGGIALSRIIRNAMNDRQKQVRAGDNMMSGYSVEKQSVALGDNPIVPSIYPQAQIPDTLQPEGPQVGRISNMSNDAADTSNLSMLSGGSSPTPPDAAGPQGNNYMDMLKKYGPLAALLGVGGAAGLYGLHRFRNRNRREKESGDVYSQMLYKEAVLKEASEVARLNSVIILGRYLEKMAAEGDGLARAKYGRKKNEERGSYEKQRGSQTRNWLARSMRADRAGDPIELQMRRAREKESSDQDLGQCYRNIHGALLQGASLNRAVQVGFPKLAADQQQQLGRLLVKNAWEEFTKAANYPGCKGAKGKHKDGRGESAFPSPVADTNRTIRVKHEETYHGPSRKDREAEFVSDTKRHKTAAFGKVRVR